MSKINKIEKKEEVKKEPIYAFKEMEVVDETLNPYKRPVYKTLEITEEFTPFAAMQYIAKMKKEVENKLAEVEGLESMIEAYEEELAFIEEKLGLKELEAEFLKKEAERHEKMKAEVEVNSEAEADTPMITEE